jgi:hypothetical protein
MQIAKCKVLSEELRFTIVRRTGGRLAYVHLRVTGMEVLKCCGYAVLQFKDISLRN